MGLRDDELVESPKLSEDTKDPTRACTSHHPWAAFCSPWSAGAQVLPLQHCWPLAGDCFAGRFRVSGTRSSPVTPAVQISSTCLPRAVRTRPALGTCVCCRRGRLTGRVCIVFYLKLLLLEISSMPHIS